MKVRPEDPAKLTDFKILAFDCFGTLVDWESGIYDKLQPLRERLPADHPLKNDRKGLLQAFDKEEVALLPHKPIYNYQTLLSLSYQNLQTTLFPTSPSSPPPAPSTLDLESEAHTLATSIPTWPAFPDTISALQTLSKTYHLAILSNVDRESFNGVMDPAKGGALAGVEFSGGIYVAEEIGSYKPSLHNFDYLLEKIIGASNTGTTTTNDDDDDGGSKSGAIIKSKEELLFVAHGISSDHVPCKQLGISSVWIGRGDKWDVEHGGGAVRDGWTDKGPDGDGKGWVDKVAFTWFFDKMGDMAKAVGQEEGEKK